ncbi:helix-turn-helix domain-containing protein [Rugosimonospora africana]|uniref:Helix-turn-helix domain-containing protein n=1 Tax=Rugosimonospora africana TaxID=556532 RepID=A0A8J3R441_9ACTN|nr:helix-turn-helix domain-containing protein [Rugosimonospora africana]GIH21338.1 hypothetical protein Raf01_95100 [Rugosimonospora africana]
MASHHSRRPISNNHHESAPVPSTPRPPAADTPHLYTPEEAAALLRVRPSWLRKKAAAREVPCTFLGKHLRFSPADLAAIVTASTRAPVGHRPRRRAAPTVRDRDLPPGPNRSVHAPRSDDHIRDGSSTWPG